LFPQLRVRDVVVNGSRALIDGGQIMIPPAASIEVDIVDAVGAAVPSHPVSIEDAVIPSPLSFSAQRTDEHGRVVFDRLAPGRYRVRTVTVGRCGTQPLSISRLVNLGGGVAQLRIVAGGTATFRAMSAMGPLRGRNVAAIPDAPPSSSPIVPAVPDATRFSRRPMMANRPAGCVGATDAD